MKKSIFGGSLFCIYLLHCGNAFSQFNLKDLTDVMKQVPASVPQPNKAAEQPPPQTPPAKAVAPQASISKKPAKKLSWCNEDPGLGRRVDELFNCTIKGQAVSICVRETDSEEGDVADFSYGLPDTLVARDKYFSTDKKKK